MDESNRDKQRSVDPGPKRRPLWLWVLLAIVPALVFNVLFWVLVSNEAGVPDGMFWMLLALTPLLGLAYLVVLGRSYVAATHARSSALFVVGYAFLNVFLIGAGCTLLMA